MGMAMASLLCLLCFLLVFFTMPASTFSAACPMDFSYVSSFPPSPCLAAHLSPASNDCCTYAFNTFGIGLGLYLQSSGFFELPDNSTVFSCFDSYQTALQSSGVSRDLFLSCPMFNQLSGQFVRSPLLCSGIETTSDWRQKVGDTSMDTSCAGDLSNFAVCQLCGTDTTAAIAKASSLSNDNSSCFYFGVLYAAAVVNTFGPTNPATAICLLASTAASSSKRGHHVAAFIAIGAGMVMIGGCIAAILIWLWWLRRRQLYHERFVKRNKKLLSSSLHPNVGAIWYKFEEVKAATNNFAQSNLIGTGGFSSVYKGVMPDGSEVAVKRIKNCTPEGDAEFGNEVDVINSVRHRNLVALRGCCVASNTTLGHLRLLIYDFMRNGSLEDYLFSGKKPILTWPERRKIAVDAAKGIAYLHTGIQPAIIHRDIKANNILLDDNLNAQVADFGLARITEEGMTHMTTRVAGTQGYLAPEYALYGQLTEKSDVYSFGVLLLVLMSGRQALDVRGAYPLITDWAWVMVKEGKTRAIIEERIRNDGPADLMERFVLVGILCAHLLVAFRPTMSQALKMLLGDAEIPQIPDRPLPLTHESLRSAGDISSFSSLASGASNCTYAAEELLR